MSSGVSMDVEIVIYSLLALWGPPLLFAAFLLLPVQSNCLTTQTTRDSQPSIAVITARK